MANISILKEQQDAGNLLICKALDCQPGDILEYQSDEDTQ